MQPWTLRRRNGGPLSLGTPWTTKQNRCCWAWRGSGTRSLAGMPVKRGQYLRPFLALRRRDTEDVCALAGLQPWHDPSNTDPRFMRSRIRTRVMPFLEDEMGPGVAEALWRSAQILAADASTCSPRRPKSTAE